MRDHELLELAAKADGHDFVDGESWEEWAGWNPLEDDGDALRLAVKLGIGIDFDFADCVGEVSADQSLQQYSYESMHDDPYAATRHAIVRAAASIGATKASDQQP